MPEVTVEEMAAVLGSEESHECPSWADPCGGDCIRCWGNHKHPRSIKRRAEIRAKYAELEGGKQ